MAGWLQLIISTDFTQAEFISDLLESLGAASVTLTDAADQPLYEPPPGTTPLWQSTNVIGLFGAQTNMQKLIRDLEQQIHPNILPAFKIQHLEDKNWEKEWMKNFQPMQFGRRLWICPSWHDIPDKSATNILLDPGMAFGTGTHPTTAMCLAWLDNHIQGGEIVIDYGCGSGILAIAALKLGARKAWALDYDPQALLATRINAEKNHVLANLDIANDNKNCPVADIVVANILANPLVELAPTLADLVKPNGNIVLSGILQKQAQDIINQYKTWFEIADIETQDDWICLHGVKHTAA